VTTSQEGVSLDLRYNSDGLVPVVVQSSKTMEVLMVAWMNKESLELTMQSGETVFWSRSRQELWTKGSTSGNAQRVISVNTDCDSDTLLVVVDESGPACHTGTYSCFNNEPLFVGGVPN